MSASFEVPPPRPDEAALVIANGPSLTGIDLAALPKYASFGMNVAYRHWQRIGWYPTHYACLDEVVGLSHGDAIAEMIGRSGKDAPGSFFLRRNLIDRLGDCGKNPSVVEYEALARGSRYLARTPLTTGSHTLMWALTLGYRTIFLLGADCSYVEVVPGAERRNGTVLEIVRPESNPNYFFADYQQVGDLYNVPNPSGDIHLESWGIAAEAAAAAGAEVYNLSRGSRISEFDFATIDDVMSGGPITVTPREARGDDMTPGALFLPIDVPKTIR